MSSFITAEGLVQLKNYKYQSSTYTIMDNLLNGYWQAVVKLMPMWVAPNLITFVGWLLIILSYANMLRYDYTLHNDIPNYCFILAAACVWTYSTLDAIDGKQARRTKSSSPLGQLFDHGCDSFSTAFFILALGQALKLEGYQMLAIFISTQVAFWTASWMEHQTGVLITNVGQFGVTESHLIAIFIHLLTGVFGQKVWEFYLIDIVPNSVVNRITNESIVAIIHIKIGGLIAFSFGVLIMILTLYQMIKTILKSNSPSKTGLQCLSIWLVIAVEVIWVQFTFYDQYRGLVLLNFGLLCSLIVCKVIISSVTKMQLQVFHFESLPLIVGTALMGFCDFFQLKAFMPSIFWSIFIANVVIILYFLYGVINQITSFLGIYCFAIKKSNTQ